MPSSGNEGAGRPPHSDDRESASVSEDGLDNGSEAQTSSSEEERDGRFYGPDSSWRYYTREERALAATLDQTENNNLSHHLYNVHAWKRDLYRAPLDQPVKPWHSKKRWMTADEDGKHPWHPAPRLTAWPLAAGDVPRRREEWGIPVALPHDDSGTYKKLQPWTPSEDLQEQLKATFLRQAKEHFRQRQWAPTEARQSSLARNDDADDSDAARDLEAVEPRLEDADEEETSGSQSPVKSTYPQFIADDDLAGSILQPSVRHILAKQDDLLVGLHRSRLGHLQARRRRRPRSQTRSKSRSRSRPRPRSHSAAFVPSKRKRIDCGISQDEDESESIFNTDNDIFDDDENLGRSYLRKLGIRDWSEVLGIAAMVGWDQAVIDRAARRCASIFGEGMATRIMPEAAAGKEKDRVIEYVPSKIPELHNVPAAENEGSDHRGSDESLGLVGHPCPHKSCHRHDEPYEKRWRLREHLRRKHKHTKEEMDALEEEEVDEVQSRADDPMLTHTDVGVEKDEVGTEAEDRGEAEGDDMIDLPVSNAEHAVRTDGFLLPVHVFIGRSKGRRGRSASSRSTSRKGAASHGIEGRSKS